METLKLSLKDTDHKVVARTALETGNADKVFLHFMRCVQEELVGSERATLEIDCQGGDCMTFEVLKTL
ncbi:hypothetical protein Dalk_3230 [Desulfatibacillum aliphaticivorans]|uniref:Uncharacterized protein n=1 Tax=Desulfatibacillum aliphaticivorans TaxID=218208 RepID=B8FGL1_DESAL|nr:hypothetical protein [Desulfatibacillum aliphaticivorans]ACL04920.1 hypothetical protein Dalk_3230 [Desulfatibacillum aliphaticivorans]